MENLTAVPSMYAITSGRENYAVIGDLVSESTTSGDHI